MHLILQVKEEKVIEEANPVIPPRVPGNQVRDRCLVLIIKFPVVPPRVPGNQLIDKYLLVLIFKFHQENLVTFLYV